MSGVNRGYRQARRRGGLAATLISGTALGLLLASCDGPQSALQAEGDAAESILNLTQVMTVGAFVVTLVVLIATALAFRRPQNWTPSGYVWLFGGGIAFPTIVLTALVIYATTVGHSMRQAVPQGNPKIEVTGNLFWWNVQYLDRNDRPPISTANEIVLPVGQAAELYLKSADVIHSFWVPSLAGKVDMIPGRTNRIVLKANKAGVYRGQCAEYCGQMHAEMALVVRAIPPTDYKIWLAKQEQPADVPRTPFLRQGQEIFVSQGCGACHQVKGLPDATGRTGPDLTHFASRPTIAAGLLKNNLGNLAGWIASSQHLKPGNKMPSFDQLTGEELRAVASYLRSLE